VIPSDARLVRFCVTPSLRWKGKPLYREIVESARRLGLAGASVFSVEFSLGDDGTIHDARSDYSAAEVPVIIEIVEAPERIEELLDELGPAANQILATVEEVRVLLYAPHLGRDERPSGAR
jgi:PII-like signaling protein